MRNFQDTFETRKQSFISAFSIFMAVHYIENDIENSHKKKMVKFKT